MELPDYITSLKLLPIIYKSSYFLHGSSAKAQSRLYCLTSACHAEISQRRVLLTSLLPDMLVFCVQGIIYLIFASTHPCSRLLTVKIKLYWWSFRSGQYLGETVSDTRTEGVVSNLLRRSHEIAKFDCRQLVSLELIKWQTVIQLHDTFIY